MEQSPLVLAGQSGWRRVAFNDPDQPLRVTIEEERLNAVGNQLTVAPCSVTLFALEAEPETAPR